MRAPACDPDYGGRHKWADRRGLDVPDIGPGAGELVRRVRCVFCSVVRVTRFAGYGHRGRERVLGYEVPA